MARSSGIVCVAHGASLEQARAAGSSRLRVERCAQFIGVLPRSGPGRCGSAVQYGCTGNEQRRQPTVARPILADHDDLTPSREVEDDTALDAARLGDTAVTSARTTAAFMVLVMITYSPTPKAAGHDVRTLPPTRDGNNQ